MPIYKVILAFTDIEADTPLDAVLKMINTLDDSPLSMWEYNTEDEKGNKNFIIPFEGKDY